MKGYDTSNNPRAKKGEGRFKSHPLKTLNE